MVMHVVLAAIIFGPIWIGIHLVKSIVRYGRQPIVKVKKDTNDLRSLDALDVLAARFREEERSLREGKRKRVVSDEEALLLARLYQVDQDVTSVSSRLLSSSRDNPLMRGYNSWISDYYQ